MKNSSKPVTNLMSIDEQQQQQYIFHHPEKCLWVAQKKVHDFSNLQRIKSSRTNLHPFQQKHTMEDYGLVDPTNPQSSRYQKTPDQAHFGVESPRLKLHASPRKHRSHPDALGPDILELELLHEICGF